MKRLIKRGAFLFALLLAMVFSQLTALGAKEIDQMPDLEPGKKGSLTVELSYKDQAGKEIPIEGVTLELFKVADLTVINGGSSTYTLTADFAQSNLSFDGMKASESNEAAKALKAIVQGKKLQGVSVVTNQSGKAVWSDLEPAMYLVVQTANADTVPLYTEMDPYLVSVPLGENADGQTSWKYEVNTEPKVEVGRKPTTGKITVTKRVGIYQGTEIALLEAVDSTFYFGIFKDEEGTVPFREDYIQAVQLKNASAGTAVFEELPEGTYYIFEVDSKGTVIKPDQTVENNGLPYVCIVEGSETTAVAIDPDNEVLEGKIAFNNVFYDLPSGYYMEAEIQIKKNVYNGTDKVTVDDVFYAGIFTKENGSYVLNQVVELKQNGTVTVPVMLSGDSGQGETEYWIFETDKSGKRIEESTFSYEVSGEGSVKLSKDDLTGSVELTNKIKKEALEESTEKATSNGVQTGDETPIVPYIAAFAAALLVMILIGIRQWKRKQS